MNSVRETKAFLKGIGIPIPATIWSMDRIALLTTMLTPDKRDKITQLVRELSEEVKVADIMFLSELGRTHQVATHLLSSVKTSNDAHRQWACRGFARFRRWQRR